MKAVDGDTIDVRIDLGFSIYHTVRLRLARINTPEKGEQGYQEAKDFVSSFIGCPVLLKTNKEDKYGRYIAEVTLQSKSIDYGDFPSLNDILLQKGLAKTYGNA
jgi:micrococcal nuclease